MFQPKDKDSTTITFSVTMFGDHGPSHDMCSSPSVPGTPVDLSGTITKPTAVVYDGHHIHSPKI